MDKVLKQKLIERAKQLYSEDNSGHDFSHIERVLDYCKKIQNTEHADWDVVFVSALFHDVHRVMSCRLGTFVSAKNAMDEVGSILAEFNFDNEFLAKVLYVIENHDDKDMEISKMPIELQIVQDADILDAVGIQGLKRTLKYCKTNHIPVTSEAYPLDCDEYIPDVNPISTTHYITRTMIPQVSKIHTKTAKLLAKEQIQVLKEFVDKSLKEHNVNNYDI